MSLKFKYVIALIERRVFAKKLAKILLGRMLGKKRLPSLFLFLMRTPITCYHGQESNQPLPPVMVNLR